MFRVTARKSAGYISIVEPDKRPLEFDTLQCVHCGGHWRVQPGSGRKRGYCMRCNGVTCGQEECETKCEPEEVKIWGEQRKLIIPVGVKL